MSPAPRDGGRAGSSTPRPRGGVPPGAPRGRLIALPTSGTAGRPRHGRPQHRVVGRTPSPPSPSCPAGMPTARVWIPGPLSATMNLFAAVHARWAGARPVDRPGRRHPRPADPRRRCGGCSTTGTGLRGRILVVAGDALDADLREPGRGRRGDRRPLLRRGRAVVRGLGPGRRQPAALPRRRGRAPTRRRSALSASPVIWARSPYLAVGTEGAAGPLRHDADGFRHRR